MQNDYQNNDEFIKSSIFKIGMVVAVDGRKITIKVDKTKNLSHILYKGRQIKNVSVGNYIKIMKGFTVIIAKIDSERIEESKYYSKTGNNEGINYTNAQDLINRYLIVSLLGFFNGNQFERGIKELPLVYDECFLLDGNEYRHVHNFLKDNELSIDIGALALDNGQKISLSVNNLFASHIGIFGNTGSGKSYTLAKIYNSLFTKLIEHNDQYKSFFDKSKIYLFDFNGEYINDNDATPSINEYKKCYKLENKDTSSKDNKFPICVNMLEEVEFWSVFLDATEKTQKPFLQRALETNAYFNKYKDMFINKEIFKTSLKLIIDELILQQIDQSNFYYLLNSLAKIIPSINEIIRHYRNCFDQNTSNNNYYLKNTAVITDKNANSYAIMKDPHHDDYKQNIHNPIDQLPIVLIKLNHFQILKLRFIFQYVYENISDQQNSEFIKPLCKRFSRIESLAQVIEPVDKVDKSSTQMFHVISLRMVNLYMKKTLPLLICKQIYENHKQEQKTLADRKYLNIIIDEAHNILSYDSSRENEIWKDYRLETFEEIIKEGRKFGVFLTVASQRPSDISHTIISQLHHYFLHRLINNRDIEAVEKTISYLDKVSFDYLSILPTGVCIFAGLSAQIPVVLQVGEVEQNFAPLSDTINLTDLWSKNSN